MIDTIYIEEEIANHPRTLAILKTFFLKQRKYLANVMVKYLTANHKTSGYKKKQPALILARKHKGLVLPSPKEYAIGAEHNYYFSHMLNCLYDCRYCFLQGKFQSAHYVLFVNYEDFIEEMQLILNQHDEEAVHFFSGYDCDSLALEPVTDFTNDFFSFL